MARRLSYSRRVRKPISTRKKIKLTDTLFNEILDNYRAEYEDRLVQYFKNGNSHTTSPLLEEGYIGKSPFPFASFVSYTLTIPQFEKFLDFCFNGNDYDPTREGDPWITCISKYSLALKIFNSSIAPNNAYKFGTKISNKVKKCYELYLDRLVKSKIPGSTVLSYGLLSFDTYGLGEIGSRYLSKFDFYKTDDKVLDEEVFNTYCAGFSYRDYNNARCYNRGITNVDDEEFLDVIDIEKFKLEDNFPYTKEEVKDENEV